MTSDAGPAAHLKRVSEDETRAVQVVDLAVGNIGSVMNMLSRLGARPTALSCAPSNQSSAPIVLPGVGHFTQAVKAIDAHGWRDWLSEAFERSVAILGVCLGAQLMCESSEEGEGSGLAWIPTVVRRFPRHDPTGQPIRVPHIGWQPFTPPNTCLPFSPVHGRMYYAHSYLIEPCQDPAFCPYQSSYAGVQFASIVCARRAMGVQFHPERSHRHGMDFLRRWLHWSRTQEPS